eukprot:TRINITY_DN33451_c0_g1_i1.p1 TRINITY_DN33451_c0_g1~~TRINITY_DN33451_c0_g1_i1.p1  ORF type:complete len:421 (+),score=53.46 TRINITY_DN33451_c0_g1_i1:45-1307(+)
MEQPRQHWRSTNPAGDQAAHKLMIGLLCCTGVGLFCVISSGVGLKVLNDEIDQAKKWDGIWLWEQVECTVLSTGVSCVDEESGSTCAGYPAGKVPSGQPMVFLTEAIAACPGSYWCAKEGDMCNCTGQVTYATELFNGERYTYTAAQSREFSSEAHGLVQCGLDGNGRKFRDPAPGRTKHCWCSPEELLELIGTDSTLNKEHCAAQSTASFDRTPEPPNQIGRRMDSLEANDSSDGSANLDAGTAQEKEADVRHLTSSPRRRRTYSYAPWALVKVPLPHDSFSSGDASSRLACAYEHGVPKASYGDFESDGAYSGAVWQVEDVVKKWGKHSHRQCWVRTEGRNAREGAECAVAMERPGALEEKRKNQLGSGWFWFWIQLGALMICCVPWFVMLFGAFQAYRESRGGTQPYGAVPEDQAPL